MLCSNNHDNGSVLIFLDGYMGWVPCWPWTNSALVCIIVAFVLGFFVVQCGMSRNAVCVVILPSSCAVQTHYNDDDGSALIFVGWMYAWNGCWPWSNSAYVCIAACVLEFDGVTGVQLMQYEVVISPSCAIEIHSIMVMTALRWSSILECIMGPVSCWPWTNSAYVYIAWIWHVLLQYDVVIILSSSYAVQIHYNGDDGSALIVVGWMYVMGLVLTLNK